ncbi:hypothetical protein HYG81_25695 (plasmid) [Natrinema zhouii]|uniref:hypothetical protein n=1 Tax=Natrinema zhouii TaxID=1710539 RepID=UPI001CFFD9BB|nr:hypothetical protein [Natrinema zhouii]UHQ99236.1 hypothetical protein HYG81_25695 [Natrinema zhouii]
MHQFTWRTSRHLRRSGGGLRSSSRDQIDTIFIFEKSDRYVRNSPDFGRRRRSFIQAAAGALVVGMAGCTELGDDNPDTQEYLDNHDGSNNSNNSGINNLDIESLRQTFAEQTDSEDGTVALGIGFAEDHLPITSELYEPDPDASISDTDSYETTELSDVDLVDDSVEKLPTVDAGKTTLYSVELEPGESRTMAIAVQSDEGLTFGAERPEGQPYGIGSGLVLNCYCMDEMWNVPADGTWARVIEVGLEENIDNTESGVAVYSVFDEE